jgi:hypothetical protein
MPRPSFLPPAAFSCLWRFSCLKRQRPARGKSCFRPFADYLLWQALVDLIEAAATMQPSVRRALEGIK